MAYSFGSNIRGTATGDYVETGKIVEVPSAWGSLGALDTIFGLPGWAVLGGAVMGYMYWKKKGLFKTRTNPGRRRRRRRR